MVTTRFRSDGRNQKQANFFGNLGYIYCKNIYCNVSWNQSGVR